MRPPSHRPSWQGGMMAMRKLVWVVAAVLMLGLAVVPKASADVFTFNVDYCTNTCLGGVPANNNGGTVTVTQVSAGIVQVSVSLTSLLFHDEGLNSFAFNISGNPVLGVDTTGPTDPNTVRITDADGGTCTFIQPATNTDGAGKTFGYAFNCA